ncbi:hypothetical protein O3M35_005963 [Rhynocoris fuscipes]|uniref:Uncharacterized protein n=1 Tax=Rhynocoris fuscipes TaxID=488301 RepID=A0AAW1DE39_9HEMI
MEETSIKSTFDEKTNESPEEINELSLGDESWSELLDTNFETKCQWKEELPLSDELRQLDEEQKQQIAEARAWVEEEEAMDEILRQDIAELQRAKQKIFEESVDSEHHYSKDDVDHSSPVLSAEIPPEARERILELENKVKNLQDQLDEKTVKVAQVSDLYTELLSKLNESRERSLATDREFKASFARIKEDYAEVESLLKSEIERYKATAKQIEFKLTEKELEVTELRKEREELLNSKTELETKYNESVASVESLNKYILKIKVQLKNIKTERDNLKKEMINLEDIEVIKQRLSQLEEERNALLKEKENAEDVKILRDRIALLEEEKGNLLLQVIDLDEIKETAKTSQKQFADLENSFAELKNNASLLEVENQRISSNYEKAESKIKEQQAIIDRFLRSAQESEEQKIMAVMRSVELEEQLSYRDKEISQLKQDFSKLETSPKKSTIVEKDDKIEQHCTEVDYKETFQDETVATNVVQLFNAEQHLSLNQSADIENLTKNYEKQLSSLENSIQLLTNEKSELLKQLEESKKREEILKKEMNGQQPTSASQQQVSETDPLYQKFKKVVANYKIKTKLCQELESKIENLNIQLTEKDVEIQRLIEEKNQLTEVLSTSDMRINELENSISVKSMKINELIRVIEQIYGIEEGLLNENFDSALLNDVVRRCKDSKEADIQMVQQQMCKMNSVLMNVAKLENELEELKKSLKEKDDAINELENERAKLSDVVKFNEKELEMLRSMYEKVSEKNEHFYTDLMSIEKEMANGKTELLSRLEVVTQNYDKCLSNLQERENYIETLEQDIVSMKTKMYNIESGMDERHRILKETSDQLMAKFQAAEIMSQTFEKYKSEVEKKIDILEMQKRKAEENERLIREQLVNVEENRLKLQKDNEELNIKLNEMSEQLENLLDIKNSYNTTLDKIEELNSELTQTTLSFELKSERLENLEQERMELVNKLTDLEDAYSDVETKLDEYTEKNTNLQNELHIKSNDLETMKMEKLNLIKKTEEIENSYSELVKKYEEINNINNNLLSDLNSKTQQLQNFEEEKRTFLEKYSYLENQYKEIYNKFLETVNKNKEIENELLNKNQSLSEANQKLFDLQTQIVETEALNASIQDDYSKLEKNLEVLKRFEEENRKLKELLELKQNEPVKEVEESTVDEGVENKVVVEQSVGVFQWSDQAAVTQDNPFGDIKDEEDGWGWMAQEAALEHDHKHSEALKIQELTTKLNSITEEKDLYLNELNIMKTKCQKLMIKLKEMKTLNENLERAKTVGFSDLDFALQEELRAENDRLQLKLTELNTQLISLKTEKESMVKRLDTLISANEQLVDLKERQDLEVQMWQKKSNQLMNEVKFLKSHLETDSVEGGNNQIDNSEMSDKITALVRENEELKTLLETKKRELDAIKEIDLELPEKFAALVNENEELTSLLNKLKYDNEIKFNECKNKIDELMLEKENLLRNLEIKDKEIEEFTKKIHTNLNEIENLKLFLDRKENELLEIKRENEMLYAKKSLCVDFSQQTENFTKEEDGIKMFSFNDNQQDTFEKELQKNKELEELLIKVQQLNEEKINLENYIKILEKDLKHVPHVDEETGSDRNELYSMLEDCKREVSLWKQKAEDLTKEFKLKEEHFNQIIFMKDEENVSLLNTLSAKEQTLQEVNSKMETLRTESERMKNFFTAERDALQDEIKRLATEQTLAQQQNGTEFFNNKITDLQNVLDETIKDCNNKDIIINNLKQQIQHSADNSNHTEIIRNLEQEKAMVETLLKETQAEVVSLRNELTKRKNETLPESPDSNILLTLKEKDNEIGRLTKTVVEMQERLLRMEEGRLLTSLNDLQKRLDHALYTAHLRDVQCEELTQEILQLLEERDNLQFRLAESLRTINNLTNKDESVSSSSSPVHLFPSQSPSSPANEKLNKLRHEYRRDPNVQMESESRHVQHMQLYSHQQSPINEEANTSADYGFFNWFFGGSSVSPSRNQTENQKEESP